MRILILTIIISIVVCSCSHLPISSETKPFKIHKLLTASDFNDADIPFIAAHFDIIDTWLTKAKEIVKIKDLNPSFKAIFYKHALSYRRGSEDLYAHDAHTWAILKQTN